MYNNTKRPSINGKPLFPIHNHPKNDENYQGCNEIPTSGHTDHSQDIVKSRPSNQLDCRNKILSMASNCRNYFRKESDTCIIDRHLIDSM